MRSLFVPACIAVLATAAVGYGSHAVFGSTTEPSIARTPAAAKPCPHLSFKNVTVRGMEGRDASNGVCSFLGTAHFGKGESEIDFTDNREGAASVTIMPDMKGAYAGGLTSVGSDGAIFHHARAIDSVVHIVFAI